MAKVDLFPNPEQFWAQNYGIDSRDEFAQFMDGKWPSVPVIGGATDVVLTESAFEAPYGPMGLYAQGRLKLAGYTGSDATVGSNILTFVTDGLVHALQETAMVQLIIPGCYQVSIQGVSGGQAVDNVIGLQNSGGSAAAAAQAVKDAWEVLNGPLTYLPASYQVTNYHAVDIGSANGDIVDVPSTAVGKGSGGISTNAAAALVKWNGGTRSRSARGRLYYGPQQEAAINADGRTLVTAVHDGIQSAFGLFRTSLEGDGYPLVVLSRTLSTAFAVTSHSVENVIATQRRRIR